MEWQPGELEKWSKNTVRNGRKPRTVEIHMAAQQVKDRDLSLWCSWARNGELSRRVCGHEVTCIDMSSNQLTDEGFRHFMELLHDLCLPVQRFKLHKNSLGDGAASLLAQYMREYTVQEIHLSHNILSRVGVEELLRAAAAAAELDQARYPIHLKDGGRPAPLWLRLHENQAEGVDKHLKELMLQERRASGHLSEAAKKPPILACYAEKNQGCDCFHCSKLCPGEALGVAIGPVVHVPLLWQQRREKIAVASAQMEIADAPQERAEDVQDTSVEEDEAALASVASTPTATLAITSSTDRCWEKYALPEVDVEKGGAWWCCASNPDDYFIENTPGVWRKYEDPSTGKPYWCHGTTQEYFFDMP